MQMLLVGLLRIVCATTLYLIRHAEKPELGTALSTLGTRRSQCLISVFTKQFKPPKRIISQPATENIKSTRPFDTVVPLAHYFNLEIEQSCGRDNIECIRKTVMVGGGPILISWEHKRLAKILQIFVGGNQNYPKNSFNIVWTVDTEAGTFLENIQEACENIQIQNPTSDDSQDESTPTVQGKANSLNNVEDNTEGDVEFEARKCPSRYKQKAESTDKAT